MIDNGVCPWCQTFQLFAFYGRQRCQVCSKPILVTPDRKGSDIWQNHVEYWNGIIDELQAMRTELEGLGLAPRKMIAEVARRIERLSLAALRHCPSSNPTYSDDSTLSRPDK